MHKTVPNTDYILASRCFKSVKLLKSLSLVVIFGLSLVACSIQSPADEGDGAVAGNPVTIAQQWKSGQKWPYNVDVTGKMDLRFPADTPKLGRMAFKDMSFSLNSLLTLDVLKSDDNGVGNVALCNENIEMKVGTAAGSMEIKDGEMQIFVNNQPFGQPAPVAMDNLKNPDRSLRLDAQGHFLGTEPIPGARPANFTLPPYLQNLMQAFDPRILPAMWPDKPVSPGQQWTNIISLPLAEKTAEEKQAGNFEWTYIGQEVDPADATRKLQRLRLKGDFKISSEQAALLAAQIGDTRPGTPQDTVQKLSGDVLFDTQIGQIRDADLKVQFYSARQASTKIRDRVIDDSSWTIFDGTMHLALNSTEN